MRRRSMYGTALFVLGILALVAAAVPGRCCSARRPS